MVYCLPQYCLPSHFIYYNIVMQVIYQIANIYELLGDIDQAIEWYLQLLGLTPSDPVILQKMGALFDNEGDKQQAYQYHFDSYRYFPSNLGLPNTLNFCIQFLNIKIGASGKLLDN